MKRFLVVLTCLAVLLAGVSISASAVGAQSNETTYSLDASGSVTVHDRKATIGGTERDITSLVGVYPGEEVLVNVAAPEDELAVVTVRTADGTVRQKDSVTTGESVLVDSSEYDPGTYYLVLSTDGQVRTVSLLIISKYWVSFGFDSITDDALTGDVTVAGGVSDAESVQLVLSNDETEFRTKAETVRKGLYDFSLALEDVPDGNYTAIIEVVKTEANGTRTILATSQVRTVTVGSTDTGESVAVASDTTETKAGPPDASAGVKTATKTAGLDNGETVASTESDSTVPDLSPVVLFAILVSLAIVARIRRLTR
ncbi:T9SS type A sorting domain-containing protein [Halogeometricum borinquense]|uniref:T9SS type A sorting domain-containing protein n=1 Tax=Halogeometricum borinquense TaxID=60847 RepID=UPI003418546E